MKEEILLQLYKSMLRIRRFEEKIISVYGKQDMRTPVHLSIGQEAIAAGACCHLSDNDFLFSTHRNHGHCLAKGVSPKNLLAEYYGKKTGCCKGKGGSMHAVSVKHGILGTSAIVGGGIPIAVGVALACQMRKNGSVTVVFFGDGAVEEGTFHESLNFAALKRLPVVFVCENNFYATASPLRQRQPPSRIADRAFGYGLPGVQIDGNDVSEVYRHTKSAVDRARSGEGPSLVEAVTYRWMAHVGPEGDVKSGHRKEEEVEEWKLKCPIMKLKKQLMQSGALNISGLSQMESEVQEELDEAMVFAIESPDPNAEDLLKGVYA